EKVCRRAPTISTGTHSMLDSAPVVASLWCSFAWPARLPIRLIVGSVKPVARHSPLLPSQTFVLLCPGPILHDISLRRSSLLVVPSKASASKLLTFPLCWFDHISCWL